jgi:hypothetical protein
MRAVPDAGLDLVYLVPTFMSLGVRFELQTRLKSGALGYTGRKNVSAFLNDVYVLNLGTFTPIDKILK